MPDPVPDIFADGVTISVGPFGVTVSFQRSTPDTAVARGTGVEAVPVLGQEVVGRIRMDRRLLDQLGTIIQRVQQASTDEVTAATPDHPESSSAGASSAPKGAE